MAGIPLIRRRVDSHNDEDERTRLLSTLSSRNSKDQQILNNFNSYYSATILMYFLISVGIGLTLVPILTEVSGQSDNLMYRFVAVKIIRNVYSTLVSLVFMWFVKCKSKWVKNGYVWWPKNLEIQRLHRVEDHLHRTDSRPTSRSSLFGPLLVLGTGSAIMITISIITAAQCLYIKGDRGSKPLMDTRIMNVANDVVYLILLLSQLLFFYSYDGAVFASRSIFHYAMAICIASNIWGWVGVTVSGPFWDHFKNPYGNESFWCNEDQTEAHHVLLTIQHGLSILFPEYSTMAISMLCCYWSTMTSLHSMSKELNPPPDHNANCIHDHDDDSDSFSSDITFENDYDEAELHARSTIQTKTVTIFASFLKHRFVTFVSFTVTASHMVLNIATQYGKPKIWATNHPEDAAAISGFFSIAIFLTATYLIVQCHFRLRNTLPNYASLGSNDYLLVFTATWCFVYDILQFTAANDLISSGKTSLGIIGILHSLCFLADTCLQTRFLLTIQRVKVIDVASREYIRSCLIYLMIVNAGNWVLTGLAHEWADGGTFTPLISMSFDGDVEIGSIIILAVFPMMSLYRFHSTVICCEMLKTMYQPSMVYEPEQHLEFETSELNSGWIHQDMVTYDSMVNSS